jgi:hypothetical protein
MIRTILPEIRSSTNATTITYSSATAMYFPKPLLHPLNRHSFDLPSEIWIMIADEIYSYYTLVSLTAACHRLHGIFFPFLMRYAAYHYIRIPTDMTVLHWASERGYIRVVKGLLEAGGNVNALDSRCSSALMLASNEGHESVVECLIAYNAALDINSGGQTALTYAAQSNHPDILIKLFDRGATFDRRHWWTILFAATRGYVDVARILLEHGVDPNFRLTSFDDTIPECDLQYRNTGHTAIILAVSHRHPNLVALLMENGAKAKGAIRYLVSKESPLCTRDERCLYELCGRSRRRTTYWKIRCSHLYVFRAVFFRIDEIVNLRFPGPFSALLKLPMLLIGTIFWLISLVFVVICGRLVFLCLDDCWIL